MSAAARFLTIICNHDFPSSHAELLRLDGSVLAEFDDGDDRNAFSSLFQYDEAEVLVLSPDLFQAFVLRMRVAPPADADEMRH